MRRKIFLIEFITEFLSSFYIQNSDLCNEMQIKEVIIFYKLKLMRVIISKKEVQVHYSFFRFWI